MKTIAIEEHFKIPAIIEANSGGPHSKMARTNEEQQPKRTHIFGRAKLNSQTLVVILIIVEESNVNTRADEVRETADLLRARTTRALV